MNNERVTTLIDLIEENFRELAELTGVNHISAFLINGSFNIEDYSNWGTKDAKFSEFREGGKQ